MSDPYSMRPDADSPKPSETGPSAEALTKASEIARNCKHPSYDMAVPCLTCIALALEEATGWRDADIAVLTDELADERAFCICGCSPGDHESYGEEGEACQNESHACIRVAAAVVQIAANMRHAAKRSAHLEDAGAGCWICGGTGDQHYAVVPVRDRGKWRHTAIVKPSAEWLSAPCERPEVWDALSLLGGK